MRKLAHATHAIVSPDSSRKILLLRGTTNPTDPIGAYAVVRIVTRKVYDLEYSHCELIQEKPTKILRNAQDEPDGIVIGSLKEKKYFLFDDPELPAREEARRKAKQAERTGSVKQPRVKESTRRLEKALETVRTASRVAKTVERAKKVVDPSMSSILQRFLR